MGRVPVRERQVATDLDAVSDESVTSGFAEGGATEVQVLPDSCVAEGNLSLCGEPESCQQAEVDGQVEGVQGPAPSASDDGAVQPDDPADLCAGEAHFPVQRGLVGEQVIVDDEAVGEQRDLAGVVKQRPLHLKRPGDVRAGEHDLAGACGADDAEVAVDLGERRGQPGEPRAVKHEVPGARAGQVDACVEFAAAQPDWSGYHGMA